VCVQLEHLCLPGTASISNLAINTQIIKIISTTITPYKNEYPALFRNFMNSQNESPARKIADTNTTYVKPSLA
jgi:hypothetical protein